MNGTYWSRYRMCLSLHQAEIDKSTTKITRNKQASSLISIHSRKAPNTVHVGLPPDSSIYDERCANTMQPVG